jgi:hypothetical protein
MSDMEMTEALRSLLWEAGFRPVPVYNVDATCNSPGKQPRGIGWLTDARLNPPAAAANVPTLDALNTGILCDGLRAIDIDVDDADVAAQLDRLAGAMLGVAPKRVRANSGRCLRVYRAFEGEPSKRVLKGAGGEKVEVLGKGQQFVGFWTHPSGSRLEWAGDILGLDVQRDGLTAVTEDQISTFLDAAEELLGSPPSPPASPASVIDVVRADDSKLRDIEAALDVIPDDGGDYDFWIAIGMATHAGSGGSPDGLALWDAWSRKSIKYDSKAVIDTWRSFAPGSITIGTLFHHAKVAQPGWLAPSWNDSSRHGIADSPSLALLDRSAGPCPPIPITAFGPMWSAWLASAAAGTNAPVDYVVLPLLAAASALIGNSRWVRAWDGWVEPPVLWCGAVGDPSSGKSSGAAPVMRDVLRNVETWMSRDYPAERDKWAAQNAASAVLEQQWGKKSPLQQKMERRSRPSRRVSHCRRLTWSHVHGSAV